MPRMIIWLAFFGMWLAVSGRATPAELVLGAVAAATATFLLEKVPLDAGEPVRLRRLPRLARIPYELLRDCGLLLAVLFRRLFVRKKVGRLRLIPFGDGFYDRALALTLVTFLPNTLAIGIDKDEMLIHELTPREERPI